MKVMFRHAVLSVGFVCFAATAAAQGGSPTGTARPGDDFRQVIEQVAAQGYSDIREIERKSERLFEVKARDASGQRVELYIDARSGEILKREVKHPRQ